MFTFNSQLILIFNSRLTLPPNSHFMTHPHYHRTPQDGIRRSRSPTDGSGSGIQDRPFANGAIDEGAVGEAIELPPEVGTVLHFTLPRPTPHATRPSVPRPSVRPSQPAYEISRVPFSAYASLPFATIAATAPVRLVAFVKFYCKSVGSSATAIATI